MRLSKKRAAQIAHQLAPVYKTIGWTWGAEKEPPSEEAIGKALVDLAKHWRAGSLSARIGGLVVARERDELGDFEPPYIAFEWRFPWDEEEVNK